MARDYYNRRTGQGGEPPKLTLRELAEQVGALYDLLDDRGYLQKAFGYFCVDAKRVAGDQGSDIRLHFYLSTGIRVERSVRAFLDENADESGLFTMIEFLHDHVAKPDERTGSYHDFSNCGWHFDCRSSRFDVHTARSEWRTSVNRALRFYGAGFELSSDGEIVRLVPEGLEDLTRARTPVQTGETNIAKVDNAIRIFRLGRATREQRKQAVRELADLLEFYRPEVKAHLLKDDEGELFNIANNFAIRHHRRTQKDDYGEAWLTWMFYTYLATVRLVLELVHGPSGSETAPADPQSIDMSDDDIEF